MHLIFDELERTPRTVHLDASVAALVASRDLVTVAPAWQGGFDLLPAGRVGAVQVEDLLIEVRPKSKVGLDRILFLLGYATNPGFRPEDVSGATFEDLFSALAESVARQVERALRLGPISGYVHVEEALRSVRGRLRVGEQLARHPGMLLPLEVSYDEYTVNIPENRILRSALRRLQSLPRLTPAVARRLRHLDAKLDGVGVLLPGEAIPPWQPSRLNEHYLPALRISELVLRNLSSEAGLGGQTVASFIVDMAKVFEDFVTVALREEFARRGYVTHAQYSIVLDEPQPDGNQVQMFADTVLMAGGRPSAVFDAKYKASWNGAYANADQYQMLAYCMALGVRHASLLYADSGATRTRRVVHAGVEITEVPLDLSASPGDLLRTIARLADRALFIM